MSERISTSEAILSFFIKFSSARDFGVLTTSKLDQFFAMDHFELKEVEKDKDHCKGNGQ